MGVEAVIATQVIDTTSVGRSLMTAADAAAARTAADAQVTLVSGTNIKTINSTSLLGSGDIAVGVSGTGSVDNAVLRADGTGGATLQSSAFVIADNATASPNNTVNHASIQATGGTTNVSVSIVPKGSGAFCLQVPDGTATGGNVRGANAVDLQTLRSNANQVASGTGAFLAGVNSRCTSSVWGTSIGDTVSNTCEVGIGVGRNITMSGQSLTIAVGQAITVSAGYGVIAFGNSLSGTGTAYGCVGIGSDLELNSEYGFVTGYRGRAHRKGQRVHASGYFSAIGDAQAVSMIGRVKTTNATPTLVTLWGDGATTERMIIPSGKLLSFTARITGIKSDGSAVAEFLRRGVIKNVGGTTSLVGSVETIGTDIEDNSSTDVTITADNTNDALDISVTGIASETWRWVAVVEGLEIAYGS